MPGGLTSEAKSLLTTSTKSIDERIGDLLVKKTQNPDGYTQKDEQLLQELKKYKLPSGAKQLSQGNLGGDYKTILRMNVNYLKRLDKMLTQQYPNDPKTIIKLLKKEIDEMVRNSNGVLTQKDLIKAIK